MKKLTLFILLAMLCSTFTFAQDENMKKWQDYMTPGKEQQALAKMVGDWTFVSKYWMDPNGDPQVTDGTASCKMLLGGRYQEMKVAGNMMGMPFEGISLLAFDNGKKIYINTWIDNFGTGLMYAEGKMDETTKTIIFKGKMYDPMSDKDLDFKQTFKELDANNMLMEMFTVTDGKDVKNMEVKYTRK